MTMAVLSYPSREGDVASEDVERIWPLSGVS